MIDINEYIDLREKFLDEDSLEYNKLIEFNQWLVEQYPFLEVNLEYPGSEETVKDFRYTWLDDMPKGWVKAFGLDLCDEIKEELIRCNFLNEYKILQIKEKWGELRWYDGGLPQIGKRTFIDLPDSKYVMGDKCKVWDIIDKYTDLSRITCIECGNTADYLSTGWISPYCESCAHRLFEKYSGKDFNQDFVKIKDEE